MFTAWDHSTVRENQQMQVAGEFTNITLALI